MYRPLCEVIPVLNVCTTAAHGRVTTAAVEPEPLS